MKTIITLLIIATPIFAFSQQFEFTEKYVKIKATSISVKQAFELTDALPGVQKVLNRFVEKDGVTYYRAGIVLTHERIYRLNDPSAFNMLNNAGLFTIGRLEKKGLISRETI